MVAIPLPPLFGCMNKAGSLPSGRFILVRALKRYYEPLRLPLRPNAISLPYTRRLMFRNMPSLLPRKITLADSVVKAREQWPSPFDHRVGIFNQFTRLPIGSLALRPAALPIGNLRPSVTRAPLP